MLPRTARLSRPADFRRVTRTGVRAGRGTVVVHAARTETDGVRVGLVVSRAVGGAAVRNRVKRRLRHLAAGELPGTPAGTDVVVRALPPAGEAREQLSDDLRSGWGQAVRKLALRQAQGTTVRAQGTPVGAQGAPVGAQGPSGEDQGAVGRVGSGARAGGGRA